MAAANADTYNHIAGHILSENPRFPTVCTSAQAKAQAQPGHGTRNCQGREDMIQYLSTVISTYLADARGGTGDDHNLILHVLSVEEAINPFTCMDEGKSWPCQGQHHQASRRHHKIQQFCYDLTINMFQLQGLIQDLHAKSGSNNLTLKLGQLKVAEIAGIVFSSSGYLFLNAVQGCEPAPQLFLEHGAVFKPQGQFSLYLPHVLVEWPSIRFQLMRQLFVSMVLRLGSHQLGEPEVKIRLKQSIELFPESSFDSGPSVLLSEFIKLQLDLVLSAERLFTDQFSAIYVMEERPPVRTLRIKVYSSTKILSLSSITLYRFLLVYLQAPYLQMEVVVLLPQSLHQGILGTQHGLQAHDPLHQVVELLSKLWLGEGGMASAHDFKAVPAIKLLASWSSITVPIPNSSCNLHTLIWNSEILFSMSKNLTSLLSYELFMNSFSVCNERISFCNVSISLSASSLLSPKLGLTAAAFTFLLSCSLLETRTDCGAGFGSLGAFGMLLVMAGALLNDFSDIGEGAVVPETTLSSSSLSSDSWTCSGNTVARVRLALWRSFD
ncbi:hypothetical protein AKJ16_DCAP20976, partial [Drosera capensis]